MITHNGITKIYLKIRVYFRKGNRMKRTKQENCLRTTHTHNALSLKTHHAHGQPVCMMFLHHTSTIFAGLGIILPRGSMTEVGGDTSWSTRGSGWKYDAKTIKHIYRT